jgi:hypothetical protein
LRPRVSRLEPSLIRAELLWVWGERCDIRRSGVPRRRWIVVPRKQDDREDATGNTDHQPHLPAPR